MAENDEDSFCTTLGGDAFEYNGDTMQDDVEDDVNTNFDHPPPGKLQSPTERSNSRTYEGRQ